MGKKKKHVQTEKERLYQEDAARKRAQKAELAKKNERRQIFVLFMIFVVLFAVSVSFAAWSIARMHNYESNYIRVTGKITDYKIHHHPIERSSTYTLVITYTYEGCTYEISDHTGYSARPVDKIGTFTEVYVNPQSPEQATRVSSSDGLSLVSVIAFSFSAVAYILWIAILLQRGGSTFYRRALCVWLPVVLLSIGTCFLFWIGLANVGFGAVFNRFDGAVGYIVVAALTAVACLVDFCLSYRKGNRS